MHKEKKYGFTLAELMAVVIIVAILAMLGASYYRRAVEQSRFSEGLMAASAIAEGVNRLYMDLQAEGLTHEEILANMFPTGGNFDITRLDISLPGTSCGRTLSYQCDTRYYHVMVWDRTIRASRRDGIYSDPMQGYFIRIEPHFATTNKDEISCIARGNAAPKAFCESMGYTSCEQEATGDWKCTKPW